MSTEKRDAIQQGVEAQELLNNPAFARSFTDSRFAMLDAIALTDPKDNETREFLYTLVKGLPFVERALMMRINNGQIEAAEIARLAAEVSRKERKDPFKSGRSRGASKPRSS